MLVHEEASLGVAAVIRNGSCAWQRQGELEVSAEVMVDLCEKSRRARAGGRNGFVVVLVCKEVKASRNSNLLIVRLSIPLACRSC
ncbi:ADP-ribosyl cyclase/cyclic ADP-ribose hydrolase [Psidium guajava]|nr:ADP-ribosyl cyclase/cyclic ADP-ribose hydrolase [Psidium guajava]